MYFTPGTICTVLTVFLPFPAGSEAYWLASEAEKLRRGSCKVAKYLLKYREALEKVVNRTKRNSVPVSVNYRHFFPFFKWTSFFLADCFFVDFMD